ncbi:MAG: GerAB/ArcD/ProY family transporter [Agathobacter sp.]|nr:GerAB/ArcD/ProY family transporter [Agathobacter sp.]
MYVDNGKISGRQTFRLYVFDLMGIATLLLPPYLAKLCGCDGVWAIAIGSGLGFAYLFYLGWIMKRMGQDMTAYLNERGSKWLRCLVLGLVGIHSLITAGFCAYVFTRLMQHSLIQEASYEVILLVIVAVAAYAVSGGIECRARVYEVLFWFVLIPYVAMMLASVRNFETSYVDTFFVTNTGDLLKGIYLVFLLVTPLFFSLFLIREKEKEYGSMMKNVSGALLFTTIILLGSYVLLLGNFGANSLGNMRFPVVTLMSTIQFEGNFLKRMDALMVAVWFFTLFALLNLHLHYGVKMGKELWKKQENARMYKVCTVLLPALAVYGVAYGIQYLEGSLDLFLKYYSYVAVPFMVIGPGLLLIGGKRA